MKSNILFDARTKQRGFSLVEVAIVLVIVGVLLASLSGPLSTWRSNDQYRDTAEYLETARTAVMTFGRVNGYLPCPDTDNDGAEDRTIDHCSATAGQLPWLTLGLAQQTPWDAVAFYNVHDEADQACASKVEPRCFFSRNQFDFSTFSTGAGGAAALTVQDANGAVLVDRALVVMGSFGTNSAQTQASCVTGARSDEEEENCDGDRVFQHLSYRQGDAPFDDQLIWLDKLSVLGLLIE